MFSIYCVSNLLRYKNSLKNLKRLYVESSAVRDVFVELSSGRHLKLSTGKYAKLADGCAVVTVGDTSVMVTAVCKPKAASSGFVPLLVDYRQKASAAGRIPTNYLRREVGLSEKEILVSRLIDRSLRPLFPTNFNYETQLVCNMLAVDGIHSPEVASINAASAALSLSDIPWNGPVGAVQIGFVNGVQIVNPTRRELMNSQLNLIVTATKHNLVVMIEGFANNIYQQDLQRALKFATREAQLIVSAIDKLQKASGKPKREIPCSNKLSEECFEALRILSDMRVNEIFKNFSHDKLSRDNALNFLRQDVLEKIKANYNDVDTTLIMDGINKIIKDQFRDMILSEGTRCDGRSFSDLRNINCEVNLFKPLHGSSMFQRGQTQVLCTVALDSPQSALKLDTVTMLTSGVNQKNFFLHYEFPPYATGDIGRTGLFGRREVGHGALAERALIPVLPQDYPFTIRLTSEVLESNGSSSMATVCGGSMALMDAGVPITDPVAGVAIGLISKYQDNDTKHIEEYKILTDLLGIEDYLGDMDFKIAGTKKGITALQADLKIPGLPLKIIMEALQLATDAKHNILNRMNECVDKPRHEKKESWPVTEKLEIEAHQRTRLIGIGGTNIKRIFIETGVHIFQVNDAVFEMFAPNQLAMDEANEMVRNMLSADLAPELEFGGIYKATIVDIRDIGVMVTLYPGMLPALLHNSQLDQKKIMHPSAAGLELGQEIQVKYFGRDPVSGIMRLSRKVLQSSAK